MPTIETFYRGGLRTEAEHIYSGTKLITDAPLDNQGLAQSFSPTDLLSASLASCMLSIMGIAARTQGIEERLHGMKADTTKIMKADPRRVGEIVVEIYFPKDADLTEKQRKILENAAKTCPVSLSLSAELVQTVSFHY